MPDNIFGRSGPMWRRHISIDVDGISTYGVLTGENMHKVVVHRCLPGNTVGNLISTGILKYKKTTDQGHPATALVFVPNRRKYPNQDPKILNTMMLT